MDVKIATELGRQALYITLLISMPAMVSGMVIGLVISLIQSITSVQEQTLAFVPKIVFTLIVLVIALPWIIEHMLEYTDDLYRGIPTRF
ncbi:MAG: flagellar biosynthesis protein FliQ [Planctomycetota bacterium]